MLDLTDLPNFCSHEHWGSLASFTMAPEGFRNDVYKGACPLRDHTLLDIVLDPYYQGWLAAGGAHPAHAVREVLGTDDVYDSMAANPAVTLEALRPLLAPHELTGVHQCIAKGLEACYGLDLMKSGAEEIERAQEACSTAYKQPFNWYRKTMQKAGFTRLIRPVHPEYFVWEHSAESAREEDRINDPILRIDPLLELWPKKCPRRDGLAEIAGIDPDDAISWRRFLDRLFDIANAGRTAGIKQLQAYTRSLEYRVREDSEVVFRGELDSEQLFAFQDWVMHECFARAHELGWPHQVHIGTHNHPHSNPLPLEAVAKRYPGQSLVLLHCWPYLSETGFLAKQYANVHLDTCWQPVLNPQFFRRAMREWLGYVPTSKIMMAHDATSIEMAVGSSHFTKRILAEELDRWGEECGVGEQVLRRAAADMLHKNAVRLYEIGELHAE